MGWGSGSAEVGVMEQNKKRAVCLGMAVEVAWVQSEVFFWSERVKNTGCTALYALSGAASMSVCS